ncbi:MAG: hypothetical protein JSU97_02850 [Dehalococcoidia bacterium]|nr:MAG: hypothetical protein JSU97_02850 [Dehalococcoidia bacterium]
MHDAMRKLVLLLPAALLALGLIILAWATGRDSSDAQQGVMHNCPGPYKYSLAVWEGPDDTDVEEALATCGEGGVVVAYWLVPETQSWLRWFAGRPEVSTLTTLDNLQGIMALGGVGASPPSSVSSSFQQEHMHGCPKHGRWAYSVWPGANGTPIEQALTTCADVSVSAAYYLDPDTQGWHRWFLAYPEQSTLATLDHMQAVLALAAPAPVPTPTPPTPTPQPTEVTAVGQYGTRYLQDMPGWSAVENSVWIKFNPSGGVVSGKGELDLQGPGESNLFWSCEKYPSWESYTIHYEGTFAPDSNTFSGTRWVDSFGVVYRPELLPTSGWSCIGGSPLLPSGPGEWGAVLEDGVITSEGELQSQAYNFELTVQGQ